MALEREVSQTKVSYHWIGIKISKREYLQSKSFSWVSDFLQPSSIHREGSVESCQLPTWLSTWGIRASVLKDQEPTILEVHIQLFLLFYIVIQCPSNKYIFQLYFELIYVTYHQCNFVDTMLLWNQFPSFFYYYLHCDSLIINPAIVIIQELHFFNMTFSLIKARFVLSNDTITHLPPFEQILPPSHILHMHSLINPQKGQLGSGQHQTVLKEQSLRSVDQENRILFKLKIISWPQLCFSSRPMKAEWPYSLYPCETRQNDAKAYQDL